MTGSTINLRCFLKHHLMTVPQLKLRQPLPFRMSLQLHLLRKFRWMESCSGQAFVLTFPLDIMVLRSIHAVHILMFYFLLWLPGFPCTVLLQFSSSTEIFLASMWWISSRISSHMFYLFSFSHWITGAYGTSTYAFFFLRNDQHFAKVAVSLFVCVSNVGRLELSRTLIASYDSWRYIASCHSLCAEGQFNQWDF